MLVTVWIVLANLINIFFVEKIMDIDIEDTWVFFGVHIAITLLIIAITYPIMMKVYRYFKILLGAVFLNISVVMVMYVYILGFGFKQSILMLMANGVIHFAVVSLIMIIGTEIEWYKRTKIKE